MTWPVCGRLLAHAYALIDHAHQQQQLDTSALAELLHRMGVYVWTRGLGLTRARELHEQALAMRQRLYAGDHPDIARSLNNVGVILTDLGDFGGARQLFEQTLAMRQRLHEGDHWEIGLSLHNLAEGLRELGEHTRARELYEQALAMFQRMHEGDHPDIANTLTNLADDLRALGEYVRARELHEQALAMYRRLYEGGHPETAMTLGGLPRTSAGWATTRAPGSWTSGPWPCTEG